jgi:zinc/manganese transport system substrate-binding protein
MRGLLYLVTIVLIGATSAWADPVTIVAAENFYGDVAAQIGGPHVKVTSILSNPDQDPHLFEANASTARKIAAAQIVIVNGADYDPWMTKLLSASRAPNREIITVAALMHRKAGDNPHLWYDPNTMPAVAKALGASLARLDPNHRAEYEERIGAFQDSLKSLNDRIAALRQAHAGTAVTATEPVFGYMAAALGFKVRNERFQLAMMNGTEPRASDIIAFQKDLTGHAVKLLIYNSQVSEELTKKMRAIAQQSSVPVVGVTETEPGGTTFQIWMLSELSAIEASLTGKHP